MNNNIVMPVIPVCPFCHVLTLHTERVCCTSIVLLFNDQLRNNTDIARNSVVAILRGNKEGAQIAWRVTI